MTKIKVFVAGALAALLLGACNGLYLPGASLTNPRVETDHQLTSKESVLCTNLDTHVTYSFDYSGVLDAWSVQVVGQEQNKATAWRLDRTVGGNANLISGSHVSETFLASAGAAPYPAARVSASAVVQPVTSFSPAGRARLVIGLQSGADKATFDDPSLELRVGVCGN